MALLGAIGRGAGGAIAGGAKAAAGAAALGTGAFLRQAASPIPGGTAAMTAGLGIVGAVGSGAMSGFRRGGKGGAGGADGSGAGGGVEVLTQGIQKLIQVNERGFAEVTAIKNILTDMRDKAYEDAREGLKPSGDIGDELELAAANDNEASEASGKKFPLGLKLGLAGLVAIGGFIAGLVKGIRTDIGKIFGRIKTFFGKTGPIGKALTDLRAWFRETKIYKGIKDIFGKGGVVSNKIQAIKDAFKNAKGGIAAKIGEIFGKNGSMATRLATFKASVSGFMGNAMAGLKDSKLGKLIGGGVEKVKGFGARATRGAIGVFTTGMEKIKSMLQGIKDIGSKVINFVKTNPLMSKIGSIAKGFGQLLGRIFAPIIAIWSLFEGGKEGIKQYGKEAEAGDSDMYTKVIAGLAGFAGGIVGFLVGGLLDLGVSVGAWIAGKLGFDGVKDKMQGFLDEHDGFTGLIKSVFMAVASIPIAIWKWIKGALGFSDAESEEGKAGAGFVEKFKSTLASVWQAMSDLIPNMDDIPLLAAKISGQIEAFFGEQLVEIGNFMNSGIFGDNKLGNYFIKKGNQLITGGQASQAAAVSAIASNRESRVQANLSTAGSQIAGAEGGAMTPEGGFGAGTTVNNVNNNSYGQGGSGEPYFATVAAPRDSYAKRDYDPFAKRKAAEGFLGT